MIDLEETVALTGHPIGGVTSIGLSSPIKIYLDVSLKEFDFVYPAGGSQNSAFKISPSRLQEITQAEWIDVTK